MLVVILVVCDHCHWSEVYWSELHFPTSHCCYWFPARHSFPPPDIVWWDDRRKSLCFAELTVCYESNFEEAAQRKEVKYSELVDKANRAGYTYTLLHVTLEVGSRGVPHYSSFIKLAQAIHLKSKELQSLLERASVAGLKGFFTIWCTRNKAFQSDLP